jgi:hypothetical protein
MKNPVLSLLTLSCAALAVAVPNWKESLHAAAPEYFVISNAAVTQQLKVSGCKPLKTTTVGNVVLNPEGTYEFRRDDWDSANVLTGTWSKVPGKSTNTIYMSANRAGVADLFTELNADASGNCGAAIKAIEPTVLFSKNQIVVKVKDNSAKGAVQLNAKQEGGTKVGAMSAKITVTGSVVSQPAHP